MITISIISPEVSLQAINRVIAQNNFGCIFHKYVYHSLEEIETIYHQCKDSCDVIFCSGEFGYYQLTNIENISKPCTFVSYETKHFLAIALDFVLTHPDIPLNRVYCDFLVPSNNYLDLNKYLRPELMPYYSTSDELNYDILFNTAKKLWEEKKIDMVFVRSTNSLPLYEDAKIPYLYIFPDDNTIAESIRNAVHLAKLQLNTTLYKTCVLIRLIYDNSLPGDEIEYKKVTLYKYLVDFRKEQGLNFSIQSNITYFQLSSELEDIPQFLHSLRTLIGYLREKEEIDFRLGAGISTAYEQSQQQAEHALEESVRYKKNDGFLLDEQMHLIGPLSVSNTLRFSYDNEKVMDFSREQGINEANLYKIIGLFTKNPKQIITSALLARWLNITPRSCNRIIQKLCSCELISEIYLEGAQEKGRPNKTYQFVEQNWYLLFF